jgi:NADH-quinone oxidoreductase subunit G
MAETPVKELVNLTIDGKPLSVPKGTNLIEAAKTLGIEIPHYCYHPHLSIAGNCRMCQVKITGAPKMEIACNMMVREGMEVKTQHTSPEVEDAQAATLEFILINHPLDCTVCDQAGHCKLQDYHYDYNARPSRFLEEKEHKVKAEPLGPTVILDGERCIMCTRCIRFCDEVTGTSELGMLNRGDKSVISINPGKELNNPLSGTVVDLCPVGALTHREWRFNTRVWFTRDTDSICPGCSTGCNVKVYERDKQVVNVKARPNSEVNKEWLCDEGRYGFQRFLPEKRLVAPEVGHRPANWDEALKNAKKLNGADALVFVAPDLLLEDYWLVKKFMGKFFKPGSASIAYRERELSKVEALLVSPDRAPNFRGAEFAGLVSGNLEASYNASLQKLRAGAVKSVLILGDRAILPEDCDESLLAALGRCDVSVAILSDGSSKLLDAVKVALPGRSILEKAGMMVNRRERLQYSDRSIDFPVGSEPESRILNRLAEAFGSKLLNFSTDRELTLAYLAEESRLAGLRIPAVKAGGVCLKSYHPQTANVPQEHAPQMGA